MKKNKVLLRLVILIIAVLIVILVCKSVLNNQGKINQGRFRVNDAMVKSTINVIEDSSSYTNENITSLSDIKISANQENTLSLLLVSDIEPTRVYIDELKIKKSNLGNVVIYTNLDEEVYSSDNINVESVDLLPTDKDGEYLIELKINNMNIISNQSLPEGTNKVTYDGKLLKNYGISINDIKFDVKFKLNIIDETGRINSSNIKLTLPDSDMVVNGTSVVRLPVSNFVFWVK